MQHIEGIFLSDKKDESDRDVGFTNLEVLSYSNNLGGTNGYPSIGSKDIQRP